MELASWEDPRFELPDGYAFAPFPDDGRAIWTAIQNATGTYGVIDATLFDREFGSNADEHRERIFFVEHRGMPVGVSAAWHAGPRAPAGAQRLHWLAVMPDHQRRGPGRLLVLETLRRFRALGANRAYLTTGSENRRAIALYRRIGFLPAPRDDPEARAWEALADHTK